jgi:hypothetical protein
MANVWHGASKLLQRQQMHSLPGLESVFQKIQKAKKTRGKRGPHKKTSGRARTEEDEPISHDLPANWFETAFGVLPVEFAEFCDFFKRDLAPNKWIAEWIEKAENLGSKAKAEMRHCS